MSRLMLSRRGRTCHVGRHAHGAMRAAAISLRGHSPRANAYPINFVHARPNDRALCGCSTEAIYCFA
jgi:hypothetical protein